MTPLQWNEVVCDILDRKDFSAEQRYAKSIFAQVMRRVHSPVTSFPLFKLLLQSFSYAHQRFGDLTGRVNLAAAKTDDFVTVLAAYLEYIERPYLVISGITLAAEEMASWDNKEINPQDTRLPYLIVTECDHVFKEYRFLVGLQSALMRQNTRQHGCILVSKNPLDLYPPVASVHGGKTLSHADFNLEVLDAAGIIKEKQEKLNGN